GLARPVPGTAPALLLAAWAVVSGCREGRRPELPAHTTAISTPLAPRAAARAPAITRYPIHFTGVSNAVGIHWRHNNGATGRHLFIQASARGGALLASHHHQRPHPHR